jgi:plasmid stabilization system protein ParE
MRRYDLTPEAQRDLDAIAEYIAIEANVQRAISVLKDFRDAFRMLGDNPGMGHYREDLLDRRYKFWAVHSYVIAYRWETTPIQIIAIVHGARDLDAFLARRDM